MGYNFLAEKLEEIKKQQMVSFHVPGHKNGRLYERLGLTKYVQSLHMIDTTEIEGTDNLHSPEDAIKKAQERASRIFGSDMSFFLVNGTTCGIHAAIMGSLRPGEKLIMDRSSHMSAFNACMLGRINTAYIDSKTDSKNSLPLPVQVEDVKRAADKNKDAKAVYITSPTYYGDTADIKSISRIAHEKGMVLIVDCAHGSHLDLSERLPESPIKSGADISIFSLHKTLSSFTQSSIMHIKEQRADAESIRKFLAILQSSSPSYILMSSIDICIGIYEKHGKKLMQELLKSIDDLNEFLEGLKRLKPYKGSAYGFDMTKIFLNTVETGCSGYEIEKILRDEHNIQIEFATNYGIVLISSIGNDRSDFERLKCALGKIDLLDKKNTLETFPGHPKAHATKHLGLSDAFYAKKEKIPFKKASGNISAEYIIPYPPGIPIVVPGEIISQEIIDHVEMSKANGMSINGIKDKSCESIEIIK